MRFQPAAGRLERAAPRASRLCACRCVRSAAERRQETIAKTGFDSHGNPVATPGQKKPFLLDPLLQ